MELGGGGWSWVEVGARFSNTLYFLRYAKVRYVKSLFTNIQKEYNMLKISLLFKKLTNFTGK